MSALLLSFLAIEAQFICTGALILICTLAGSLLYLMHIKKTDRPNETVTDLSEQDNLVEDERSEEKADGWEQIADLPLPDNKFFRGRYNKSFTAKLMQSSELIKQYYVAIANEFLNYDKVCNRISWANSSFYKGRKVVSKFSIRGKTLYLYLALEPKNFLNSKYFITDESAVKRYETVPLRIKIKSQRGVKFGKELIEILMQKSGVKRLEDKLETVKVSDYPYDTIKNLLERGLIKLKTEDGQSLTDTDRLIWADFERRQRVSVAEVYNLISDEVAVSLIEEKEETVLSKPKGIINIDTLSVNYEAYETVTMESLKEKKLIGNTVNYVKVLGRGILNKPLIVKMPEFSIDAAKMILLTGGKVIQLKTPKNRNHNSQFN